MSPESHPQPHPGNTLLERKPLPSQEEDIILPELQGLTPGESEDLWPFPMPKELTPVPSPDSEQVEASAESREGSWPNNSGETFSFVPVEAATKDQASAETEVTKEKKAKAHKLGTLATKASVKVGRVFNKVMSNMGAISVLAPGSAMLYAELLVPAEEDAEAESRMQPALVGEIPQLIESQGFVKRTIRFRDQVSDTTRTNKFTYAKTRDRTHSNDTSTSERVEMTEHEGLIELQKFLKHYVKFAGREKNYSERKERAQSMLDSLTFIGEKEYIEAAKGLGDYWKAYLDADPKRQVCLTTNISKNRQVRKSDSFLTEMIMSSFSEDEVSRYSGRIVSEIDDIKSKPDDVKIVLLDDWTISGSQMSAAFNTLVQSKRYQKYARSVEVNLLVASAGRVKDGLKISRWDWEGDGDEVSLPVRAYYLAHQAKAKTDYEPTHITGTHSSVDFDFETDIHSMVHDMEPGGGFEKPEEERLKMPPLTNIIRTYYNAEPTVMIQKDRIIRRNR